MPEATRIAVGVARPSAQGHAITSTEIKIESEKGSVCPVSIHAQKVTLAIINTVGTNTPDTLSAICAIGAFASCASSTS